MAFRWVATYNGILLGSNLSGVSAEKGIAVYVMSMSNQMTPLYALNRMNLATAADGTMNQLHIARVLSLPLGRTRYRFALSRSLGSVVAIYFLTIPECFEFPSLIVDNSDQCQSRSEIVNNEC